MPKEILFYTTFNSYSVSDFISSLEAAKGDSICVRMNTAGGSVYDGYGAIAKFNEHTGEKRIKVDGRADSFGAYFLAFCPNTENVECLDVSNFTFHRAAMPSWFESDANYFTDEIKAQLNGMNATLRQGIESKTTPEKWKKITGVSLEDMFSLNARIDVPLSAEKMQKLGFVGKVNKITPQKLAEIKSYNAELAAELSSHIIPETVNNTIMTIADVKANSEVYNALKAEILADEKDRVNAFNEFAGIDASSVLAEIVAGNKFTAAFGAKMQVKAMTAGGVANIVNASAPAIANTVVEAPEKAKKIAEAEATMNTISNNVLARFGVSATA